MKRALLLVGVVLTACPGNNSAPCSDDAQCASGQRCRRGACGPSCLNDGECGTEQVCLSGQCKPRPECGADTDCATNFTCTDGRCQCSSDAACQANQTCQAGTCVAQKRCEGDADCAGSGKRCEVSQGLCLPICTLPQDCAPNLDPRVAFTIYTCVAGTCTRRCLNDVICGGAGLICKAGLCAVAECATQTDCPMGQYCTSATFGRCLSFQTCASTATCPANSECKAFDAASCPPGFDCAQKICQELPRCLIDGDCVSTTGMMTTQTGYCAQGHCQPTVKCAGASCGAGLECIAGTCVPSTCRGHGECGAGKACVDGACASAPSAVELIQLRLKPHTATVEVGDTVALSLVGVALGGATYPLATGVFTVMNQTGSATVSGNVVTAVGEGTVKVTATVPGTTAPSPEMTLTIYPHVAQGRRVIVVDAASHAPLAGARVRACEGAACSDGFTDDAGVALFQDAGSGAADFTAVALEVRAGDGLPRYESASVVGSAATDVYLPLRDNPVHGRGGFSATIQFSDVTTTGDYWAGFAAASVSDLPSWDLQQLLGDNFFVEIPTLNQSIPVPGPVVLYTSPGFGIPMEVKSRSLGFAESGVRNGIAFAGRSDATVALALRSTDFLSYLGAFDFALQLDVPVGAYAMVPDATDVDGDGLCASMSRCPMGTEDVPDYARFAPMQLTPRRQQQRRTEVVVPKLPGTLDQVVVAAIETSPEGGVTPTGFSSKTAGAPGTDGTRAVDPIVLRSGPPYGGLEISTPGVWVLGASNDGNSSSARVTRGPTLAPRTLVAPLLPVPRNCSYSAATHAFTAGQPEWSSVYSSGGELARVSITGTQSRHTIYFAMQSGQTAVPVPSLPAGPGLDPTLQADPRLEVVTVDLSSQVGSVDDTFTLAGPNLGSLEQVIDGYARFKR
ncbi:MAG: Ig-like domain-containing protein [Archangiaceae bacterium]|nr:Ig-like domain-containing protein [Archangiaceae bacterium]